MDKFVVVGENPLRGDMVVSGAKNVALKALVAATLTAEKVVIQNVPLIADFYARRRYEKARRDNSHQ
jgi:UDP-N-acetylglucosamine 1-carboxyvinyltransferase